MVTKNNWLKAFDSEEQSCFPSVLILFNPKDSQQAVEVV